MTGGFHAPGAKVVMQGCHYLLAQPSRHQPLFPLGNDQIQRLYWRRILYPSIHKPWEELSDEMC